MGITIKDYGSTSGRSRLELQTQYGGQVLDTRELQAAYEVKSFAAPFVILKDKHTGKTVTARFQHQPRYYFDFI